MLGRNLLSKKFYLRESIFTQLTYFSTTCREWAKRSIEARKRLDAAAEPYCIFSCSTSEEELLARATLLDDEIASGNSASLPLRGFTVALKDNFAQKGQPLHANSQMLTGVISPYDATVVARAYEAGAMFVGRTIMDEFSMGSTSTHGVHGPVLRGSNRIAGGSSGGSAAAVALGIARVALGSDTGGSVRQPAAMCGVYGLKPTYGRLSRYGLIAYASSLDTVGLLARSVDDVEVLLHAIQGADARDPSSRSVPSKNYVHLSQCGDQALKGVKIGLLEQGNTRELSEQSLAAWHKAALTLQAEGAELVPVSLSLQKEALAAYYIIASAEASSNLARYDGTRYGPSAENGVAHTRTAFFGDEVKLRLLLGTFALSRASYAEYYKRAQQVRRLIAEQYANVFRQCNVLLGPTVPSTNVTFDDLANMSALDMYAMDVFTVGANLSGVPALAAPVNIDDSDSANAVQSVQLTAPHWREQTLFAVARALNPS